MKDHAWMLGDPMFRDFLFSKGYLVNTRGDDREDCVRSLYALADIFGIRVVRNPQGATWDMVEHLGGSLPGAAARREDPDPQLRF